MLFVSLLLAFLAARPAEPVAEAQSADRARASVWVASRHVAPDGEIVGMAGWRVRLSPRGRAALVGPVPRTPRAWGPWDDTAEAGSVRLAVRTASREGHVTYVAGRFSRGGTHRSFLLRWDAALGTWTEAT